MNNEFVLYQKFPDNESAEAFSEVLKVNGIECHFDHTDQAYVKIVGFHSIDLPVSLNIKQNDFLKADEILDSFYKSQLENIEEDYYLFDFSNEELQEILLKQHEWGRLDYQLARKILTDRGVQLNEELILKNQRDNIDKLCEVKEISGIRLGLYYLFCLIMPPYSMINGFLIVNSGNILPNGQKVYTRSASDRMHGKIIIALSIVVLLAVLFGAMMEKS